MRLLLSIHSGAAAKAIPAAAVHAEWQQKKRLKNLFQREKKVKDIFFVKRRTKYSEFFQNSGCFLWEKPMSQKEKPKKKEASQKSSDEWKEKPVKKKAPVKVKEKYPKSWFQEEEE